MSQFVHIAGDRMLDLLNTLARRFSASGPDELLTDFTRLLVWAREVELLTAQEAQQLAALAQADPYSAERERFLVIEARASCYRMLFEGDAKAASHLAVMYREALVGAELRATDAGWQWVDGALTLSTVRRRIVRSLVDLARREDLDRLDQCEDAVCGRVYLDTSPRRNRRWCVTQECGDRNRARAYYARHKGSRA